LKQRLLSIVSGTGIKARALRGSALTLLSFGGSNVLRLASNLILTRILFPEAFGLMALIQVVMGGLQMFSDIGINTSIIQNKRGDDPDFLNTAWTIQIIRGFILWAIVWTIATPVANLYNEPLLAQLLPVIGITAVISGLASTKVATASRHLMIGRLTMIELAAQLLGITVAVILAYILQSVWALVFGALASNAVKVIFCHLSLPGIRNRLSWNRDVIHDLIHFGKYIFLSTIAGFLMTESGRAILGIHISLAELGVYSVGLFIGTVPLLLSKAVFSKVVLPLYRLKSPTESDNNRAQVFLARRLLVAATLTLSVPLAFAGIAIIDFLYDPRYALAGPTVVLLSLAIVPQIVFRGYGQLLLASGDSRRFFFLLAATSVLQIAYLYPGIVWLGIFGAIIAPGLAALTMYPVWVLAIRRYKALDPKADLGFLALGMAANGFACWVHRDAILALIG